MFETFTFSLFFFVRFVRLMHPSISVAILTPIRFPIKSKLQLLFSLGLAFSYSKKQQLTITSLSCEYYSHPLPPPNISYLFIFRRTTKGLQIVIYSLLLFGVDCNCLFVRSFEKRKEKKAHNFPHYTSPISRARGSLGHHGFQHHFPPFFIVW